MKEVVIKKVLTDKGWLIITEENKHLYPQYLNKPKVEEVKTETKSEVKTAKKGK